MNSKIIGFLKGKPEYVSGEQISAALNISRQALWKHIQSLKDIGYDIVAVPHLGYKLVSSPDRLFPFEVSSGLNTKFIAREIHYFDRVGSTMDLATELAMKGAASGTVVLAEAQDNGKGRMARRWFSPKYKGIYLSLILRPEILPNQSAILTLLCAVGICEAVKETIGLEGKIKWPNDIFLNNKKAGGILTELNAEMDAVRFVVVGIGLNVNNDKKSLVPGGTSLREEKKKVINRVGLLQNILYRIEDNYLSWQKQGAGFIAEKWRSHNITLGRRVKVGFHKDYIEGEAVDIDEDGQLLLRKDSGIIQRVSAGDVVHCKRE